MVYRPNNNNNNNHNNGGNTGGGGNGFKPLGLSDEILRGIIRMGFRNPTPVQRKAIPAIMSGSDTVVMARTGSGKTAAFCIPMLERLLAEKSSGSSDNQKSIQGCRALILSPTRELSLQTLRVVHKLSHFMTEQTSDKYKGQPLRAIGIHGGEGMEKQFDLLASKPDVIVATPGRLAHHLTEIPDFSLKSCTMCILDEADRLIEMGFASQLRDIGRSLPEYCQKALLSATMPKMLIEFTKSGFTSDQPQVVRLDNEATVSDELRILFVTCRSAEKDAALLHILSSHILQDQKAHATLRTGLTLIFCATRHHVEYVSSMLTASGISSTMIYGSLDQEARRSNLAAFRSGEKPILVVTDVAARGIDVPLIDHVIHYHFPPSAKLFVHRSGRAARAGRIGFCWGLVDPDELPYMVDLHLFLGRKLQTMKHSKTSYKKDDDDDDNNDNKNNNDKDEQNKYDDSNKDDDDEDKNVYTLKNMQPDMVHYGSVPESIMTEEVENVRRILNAELAGSHEAETMKSLSRVCTNAMKQYSRTRPEPSKEGIRRAKAILEGERLESGQRIGGRGSIPPHPVLRSLEIQRYETKKQQGKVSSLNDMANLKKRQEFLQAMAQFRPKETVFEAYATTSGSNGDKGIMSHVDKGRTTSSKKHDSSVAFSAMKDMRRQMRIARDKGSALVVAGSNNADKLNGEVVDMEGNVGDDTLQNGQNAANDTGTTTTATTTKKPTVTDSLAVGTPIHGSTTNGNNGSEKRRLSKAERRRLKKTTKNSSDTNTTTATTTTSSSPLSSLVTPSLLSTSTKVKTKEMRGSDFRDATFFISNDISANPEEAHRQRQMEAAMQPSNASKASAAVRIEEAMLDIVGDDREDLIKKQRMMRWDKSKRKYVQTTVGSELSGESKSKKVRLESGQLVKNDKLKLGALYEKWQKKTNRSIGRSGVFDEDDDDDVDDGDNYNNSRAGSRYKKGKSQEKGNANNYNKNDENDVVKTASQIKKMREGKEKNRIKNMKKQDRRKLVSKKRAAAAEKVKGNNQGKKGATGRWGFKKRK